MRVGMTIATFQTGDWPRFHAGEWSAPMSRSDAGMLGETRVLGRMAEPLGFDSIWVGEHFGTPYSMWPTATQSLAYWAGQTERVDVGSCVCVLPWHHPIELAHGVAMLDNMLDGRRFTLGVGRGVSKREYESIGVSREEARERFKETWEILKLALTRERVAYDGEFWKIAETSVRPRPLNDDIIEHAACAFSTPSSMEMAAREGFKQLLVTGAPLAEMSNGVDQYNTVRAEVGLKPDRPIVLMWMYCSTDERAVEKGREWFGINGGDVESHYGFTIPGAFDGVKGYEAYAETQRQLFADREEAAATGSHAGQIGQGAAVVGTDDQPIGTPETIIERLRTLQKETGAREVLIVPQFGGMPLADAEQSVRLFAQEVLPVIQADPAPAREAPRPAEARA
jgi:alkanesulfonate monooxygenase SsuD/methylene tetrahydromethanopterin reductase-like flavin-dependent oxidoreductase (luciferase family)